MLECCKIEIVLSFMFPDLVVQVQRLLSRQNPIFDTDLMVANLQFSSLEVQSIQRLSLLQHNRIQKSKFRQMFGG